MPETKLKDLHMGSFADLEKLHKVVPKLKERKAMIVCNTAHKLNMMAVEALLNGDEEMSYINYMKFLAVVEQLRTTSDYKAQKANIFTKVNRDMVNDALNAAENLKKSLLQRYEVENQLRKLDAFEEQNIVRQKIDTDRQKAKESQYSHVPTLSGPQGEDEISIKCIALFSLLKGEKKILILDARSRADYTQSHINYPQCINIPEECIEAGITAKKLEKSLPIESKHLWSQRKDMDLIVILDWSSIDFVPGKPVHLLRIILIKWDTEVIYKRSPIILEGGFEDWHLRYPSCTTNPHITPPNHNTKLDDLLNDINYPVLNDSMSPVEKKQMFDRNIKPDLHNAERILYPPYNSSGNPNVDRSSKAAALETYERNNQFMKQLLEEQERLTVASLSIEKERIETEENWQKISSTSETLEPEEGDQSDLQLKEHEILSKLMLLESNQRDTTSEIHRLKNQLEELRSEVETDESGSTNITGSLSPNANSLVEFVESVNLTEENVDMETMEQDEAAAQARLAEEALERERKIQLVELERETLNRKREAMEIEREKKLTEARARKKVLYNKHMEEDESMVQAIIPQFDRTTKPSHKIIDPNQVRLRDFQGVSGREGRGLTGLKNLGNTCYMNSIMQCLSNTAVLASYFCEGRYRQDIRGAQMYVGKGSGGTRGAVAEEVAAVVQALWSEQYRFISAKDLRNVVGRHQAMFRGIEQQDSHEFLTILMDWLHNDLQTPTRQHIHMDTLTPSEKAWLEYTKSKESLILKLFYGQMKSTVKCLECGKESVTHDSFSNLSLELPAHANKCNLSDCLELYLKDERIIGWNCPSCKQKRDAVKKLDISRLPPILVIHFKRFYVDAKDYISNTYRKKLTNIDFPLQNLDMGQFSLQSYKERKNTIYNLYGVSNHYGSMEGGHYTAYCKSSVYSKWYKFDDHVVTEISDSNVKSSAAYILFYTSLSEGTLHH